MTHALALDQKVNSHRPDKLLLYTWRDMFESNNAKKLDRKVSQRQCKSDMFMV